jgi:hypothetical protein
MVGKLLRREEASAALVLALSGTVVVLVANGPGPVSLKRVASRTLSNPVPRPEPADLHDAGGHFRATPSGTAA